MGQSPRCRSPSLILAVVILRVSFEVLSVRASLHWLRSVVASFSEGVSVKNLLATF